MGGGQQRLATTQVVALVADEANVFAGTNRGVYYSPNSGWHWTLVNDGLLETNITALALSQGVAYARYIPTEFSFHDNGAHWADASSGLTDNQLRCLGVSDSAVFAGQMGHFRSANSGETWTYSSEGLTTTFVWSISLPALPFLRELTRRDLRSRTTERTGPPPTPV